MNIVQLVTQKQYLVKNWPSAPCAQPQLSLRAQAAPRPCARGLVAACPASCRGCLADRIAAHRRRVAAQRAPLRPSPLCASACKPPPARLVPHACAPLRPMPAPCRRCSGCIAIQPCLSPSPGHNTIGQ